MLIRRPTNHPLVDSAAATRIERPQDLVPGSRRQRCREPARRACLLLATEGASLRWWIEKRGVIVRECGGAARHPARLRRAASGRTAGRAHPVRVFVQASPCDNSNLFFYTGDLR